MSDPFIGEIRMFGFNYAPYNWASCDGQLMQINQNPALYSIIGNAFGGTAPQTFALPNFQGQPPIGVGTGPGLTPQVLAQKGGANSVTLVAANLPPHTHGTSANSAAGTSNKATAAASLPSAETSPAVTAYAPDTNPLVPMAATMIAPTGGSSPHENRQPYQVVRFCIALNGIYPNFQ